MLKIQKLLEQGISKPTKEPFTNRINLGSFMDAKEELIPLSDYVWQYSLNVNLHNKCILDTRVHEKDYALAATTKRLKEGIIEQIYGELKLPLLEIERSAIESRDFVTAQKVREVINQIFN